MITGKIHITYDSAPYLSVEAIFSYLRKYWQYD